MTAFISLGQIDKNIIISLIPIILMALEYSVFSPYLETIETHKFIFNICQSFSKCLLIIPFIILKITSRSLNKQTAIKENKLIYNKAYYDKYKRITLKKYLFILLYNVLNLIFKLTYFGIIIKVFVFSFWILDIIFISLFSYLILKVEMYKHQYISMIVIICFGIILDSINSNQSIKFTDLVANILGDSVYSLQIVIKKYLMEYLFCTPYEIVFYEGFFSLIFFLLGLMISTNSEVGEGSDKCYIKYKENCYIDNLYSYLDQLNKKEIFIFFFCNDLLYI